MIPESDQIFTEVELSTLEKAINETTVLKDGVMLGEGGVAVRVMFPALYFHSRSWSRLCMFCFRATSNFGVFQCFLMPSLIPSCLGGVVVPVLHVELSPGWGGSPVI